MPDIDGENLLRAMHQKHLAEAARRGAEIEAHQPARRQIEMLQSRRQFQRAARHERMRAFVFDPRGLIQMLRRLDDAAPAVEYLTGFYRFLRLRARAGIAVLDEKHVGTRGWQWHEIRQ